jgi:hypothetical protein
MGNDLVLLTALGIDALALVEGAIENAAIVQALIDNLIERGLDPKVCGCPSSLGATKRLSPIENPRLMQEPQTLIRGSFSYSISHY